MSKIFANIMPSCKLQEFERDVALRFEMGMIPGPVHLSGGNEEQLIEIFKDISIDDYVFSTHRNHYHALLHGIPSYELMREIMAGRSMNLFFPEHKFFTSSIVGGILPIAVGVAAALKREGSSKKVWVFVGDMAATMGIFHECQQYAKCHELPITFVVEDNGLSTNTPTGKVWGESKFHRLNYRCGSNVIRYQYDRIYPHYGVNKNAII
jgi:pyruvate dehydrogenase E1 component alpha subunit